MNKVNLIRFDSVGWALLITADEGSASTYSFAADV